MKQRGELKKGETLLVTGAGGGVGTTAIEIGKAMGARVIAAASNQEKLDIAKRLGADEIVNYGDGELKEKVKELTDGLGADVIYDAVGGDIFLQCMRCINWKGRVLVIGFPAGIPKVPTNLALLKGCSIVGVFWGSFTGREPEENNKNFVINAAPGSGKTLCASFIAKSLIDLKQIDQVVVIANFSTSDQIIQNVPFLSSGNWYSFLENQNDIYTSDGNYGEFQIDAKTAVIFTNFEQTLFAQNEISPENFIILEAYPNPFNAEINLVISAKDNILENLNIFNIEGKLVKTIYNSIKHDRSANAYLFTGIRGVGKTTIARIVAKSLNCLKGIDNLCSEDLCENCNAISNSNHIDVLEMDAASKTGVDDVRELIEFSRYPPSVAKFKIFIIDEVHMLSKQAFNGLLKTLEEPPPNLKFILATTEIKKIPVTVLSRCQRFDFNRISIDVIRNRISHIMKSESIDCDAESIYLIAKKADGSMRDALSILDQSISYCGEKITYDQLVNALGIIDQELYFKFTKSISNKDYKSMIMVLSEFSKYGVPASEVLIGIQEHIRNLIYSGIHEENTPIEMNGAQVKLYKQEAVKWDRRDLFRLNQVIIDTSAAVRRSDDPYLLLEMAALKLLEMDKSIFIDQLLSNKNFMENKKLPENPNKFTKNYEKIFTLICSLSCIRDNVCLLYTSPSPRD